MKNIFIIILSLNFFMSYSQKTSYNLNENDFQTIKKINVFVKKYLDSLNSSSCNNCKELPSFFFEYNFDRKNKIGWFSFHDAISLRKLIIDNIDNAPLLRSVLKSKDKRLRKHKKIPKKSHMGDETILPFQEYSTYQLVRYRLEELRNDNSMGKNASNYPKEQMP